MTTPPISDDAGRFVKGASGKAARKPQSALRISQPAHRYGLGVFAIFRGAGAPMTPPH